MRECMSSAREGGRAGLGRRVWTMAFVSAVLALPALASAQVAWDSPFLVTPRPAPGIGLYLIEPAGGDAGAMVTWQPSARSWGFRFGIAGTDGDGDVAVFGGGDVSGGLTRNSPEFPLDIDWVLGVGAGIGDDVVLSVPLGLTVGHTFSGSGTEFTPFVSPRVVLDAFFDSPRRDDLSLDFAVDIGLDLRIPQGWRIRFAGTLGDREAIAIGLVL